MVIDQDPSERLERYRRRYDLTEALEPLDRLRSGLARREARRLAMRRRIACLEIEIAEARAEMAVVDGEITGSRRAERFMMGELLDQMASMFPEAWSPTPVFGFRMWSITGNVLRGVQRPWATPSMSATCLNSVPDDDVPHSVDRCGPPACGVYATKHLDFLRRAMGSDIDGRAVGVVAMTGKVIEHEHGYRAWRATAVAMAATLHGKTVVANDAASISGLFESPAAAVGTAGLMSPVAAIASYLNEWKEAHGRWTWEES